MIKQIRKERGFTIIEVVLVLAIAGLIFLVVFLALPALQKSQRDTGRRQDVGKVVSGLQQYLSDNRNTWPTSPAVVADGYVNSGLSNVTAVTRQTTFEAPTDNDTVIYMTGAVCDANNEPTATGASPRNAAVVVRLEGAGVLYCQPV
jgi:prepilin-type N-terminal cleavage/methylation domain-containing protein